jgi:cytochrome c oxidase cbb3-type subunit 3/ubiquinol-cytochrome c reductase cytochrome c subunit
MCAVCHGATGEGYKADQATALSHQDFLASVTDPYLESAIVHGRQGTTMSAWYTGRGGPLDENDVAAMVAYLRSWQTVPALKLDEAPVRGNIARGNAIFDKQCASCHGEQAPNVRLLNPQLLALASPGFLRHAINKGRPPTTMLGYEETLGKRGVEDVVAYLRSLPAWSTPTEAGTSPPVLALGPVPLHPKGPEPVGFKKFPEMTSVAVVSREYLRHARMALLDARVPSDYVAGHIAGAVSVPFYDPGPYLSGLPKDAWLVAYCGCPHAESGTLAEKLLAAGFTKVTVLDEGLWEWKDKSHPMREGRKP